MEHTNLLHTYSKIKEQTLSPSMLKLLVPATAPIYSTDHPECLHSAPLHSFWKFLLQLQANTAPLMCFLNSSIVENNPNLIVQEMNPEQLDLKDQSELLVLPDLLDLKDLQESKVPPE